MSRGALLLTRAAEQDSRAAFAEHGWQVEHIPCIRLQPSDPAPLRAALGRADTYDWLVFTSQNAVRQVEALGVPAALPRLAAVGPETARAVERAFGRAAELVASQHRAEGLADQLGQALAPGSRLLWLRAAEARPVLPERLRQLGHQLDEIVCYSVQTADEQGSRLGAWLEAQRGAEPAPIVVLASSKTAGAFFSLAAGQGWDASALGGNFRFACISELTAAAVRRAGVEPSFVAEEHTLAGLIRRLCVGNASDP